MAKTKTSFKKGHKWVGKFGWKPTSETKERMSIAARKKFAGGFIHGMTGKQGKRGSLSPNWKGGTQSQDRLERVKFQKTIQKKVFERDNYTCQICGIRGGWLQVDHIQSWAEYVKLRFSMKNCRTLCMDCHYLITFGKKKPKNLVWGHNLSHYKLEGVGV